MFRRLFFPTAKFCLFVVPLVVAGCGDAKEELAKEGNAPAEVSAAVETNADVPAATVADAPAATADPTAATATGRLTGVVTFTGQLPEPRTIQATKDAEFCSAGEGEVQDVIVQDGKLLGAVIELTVKGKDLPDFKAPDGGFVLRQKDCRFSPRLLIAYDGAELTVYNDDKVAHNVNTGSWNLLQSPRTDPIKEKIGYQGTPFARVTCNIHSWMETWVYVARSPLYAATAEDGTFVIEGIPAGTKIRGTLMHSVLGKQRFTADITAGETTKMDFVFEGR